MPDTYTLRFQNFRSLRDVTVDIAPLTVIYGPNGSGKSSLLYGLLTLKNFLSNPSQNIPSLFSYPSISLGGLNEVIHRHNEAIGVSLSLGISNPEDLSSKFTLTLDKSGGKAEMAFGWKPHVTRLAGPATLDLDISLPYRANQETSGDLSGTIVDSDGREYELRGQIAWNGVGVSVQFEQGPPQAACSNIIKALNERANLPLELARHTGFVPLRRGFSMTTYGLSSVTTALGSEDEVASALASSDERFRQYEVSRYIEKISNRRIQTQAQIGTSSFTIDSIPTTGEVPVSIVNEGFGINQLLYMLTISLYSPFKIVAIEEPEIHLHPSMVRRLAPALAEIAHNEDRRLIVSTHSEAFVVALLSQIAAGVIRVEDVSFILAGKEDGDTRLTQCEATPEGQIGGGLEPFMASELEDLAAFLGLSAQIA
jgi:energy-coupling factor transporter ATP-binding protein EcfA2